MRHGGWRAARLAALLFVGAIPAFSVAEELPPPEERYLSSSTAPGPVTYVWRASLVQDPAGVDHLKVELRQSDPAATPVGEPLFLADPAGAPLSTLDPLTGLLVPAPKPKAIAVMMSHVVRSNSALVLDSANRIHEYPVRMESTNVSVQPDGDPSTYGPLADPDDVGQGLSLAEAPNVQNREEPFLAIGTNSGEVLIARRSDLVEPLLPGVTDVVAVRTIPSVTVGTAPVTGLCAFAGKDSFLFLATLGSKIVVAVRPPIQQEGAAIAFSIDTTPHVHDWTTAASSNLTVGAEIPSLSVARRLVLGTGTTEVGILEIEVTEDEEETEGEVVICFETGDTPVGELGLGSLWALTQGGAGILWDDSFSLATGPSGTYVTIAGATATVYPQTLNLQSTGTPVTVWIEAEGDRALDIDTSDMTFHFGGQSTPRSLSHSPVTDDHDDDGNMELMVRFNRQAVNQMLACSGSDHPVVEIRWTYEDGSVGFARATLDVIHDCD